MANFFHNSLIKEIKDQPQALSNTLTQYLSPNRALKMNMPPLDSKTLENLAEVHIVASGASFHAGLLGRSFIVELAELPVFVHPASEYTWNEKFWNEKTLVLAISQSGLNAQAILALRAAKERGAPTLGLANVHPSPLTEESLGHLLTLAGKERSVISTKAFTSQVLVLILLAARLAQARGRNKEKVQEVLDDLSWVPEMVRYALAQEDTIKKMAPKLQEVIGLFCLARGRHIPIAREGALKFKEMSHLQAEPYVAGEALYGPLSVIGEKIPVILLAPEKESPRENLLLAEDLKDYQTPLYIFTEASNQKLIALADDFVPLISAPELLSPLLAAVPFQLLAYHVGLLKGLGEA